MGSSSSYELLAFHSVMIHKIGYMQISHVSEDNIVFIYPPSAGGSVRKGLRDTPNDPDMIFKGLKRFYMTF